MSEDKSGIFSYREFTYRRNVLKLAPDGFIAIDGLYGPRFVSALNRNSNISTDLRGGVTSISVNAAINPPGASRATVEVIAPIYKGLHEDYYLTLPNGTKISIFRPMMEIKIYVKGRFLYKDQVKYYCIFWGMITGVQENYNNGVYTFTLNCEDFLVWWKYQQIDIRPNNFNYYFGGAVASRFPSVFTNMNPWDIITIMFFDTFFMQQDGNKTMYFNFVYPTFSGSGFPPENAPLIGDTYGPLAKNVIDYWNQRFGFAASDGSTARVGTQSQLSLEMFGVKGPISIEDSKNRVLQFLRASQEELSKVNMTARPEIDYTLLGNVQPFGSFDLYGDGAESNIKSKLEIATMVCEMVNMEFFVDTNGHIVFKPPFYNLDVLSNNIPYYKIGPEDIINFNSSIDSNAIITYLTVTGPYFQGTPSAEVIGFHADFELMKRYGIRSDKATVMYGMNGKQLRAIAAAEMARRNGQAFTGGVSIPLRPETRLGYPVYIEHIDTFYYVTGITHNIVFGSSATTDLSLQFRRERIFEDAVNSPSPSYLGFKHGDVLKGCVMRNTLSSIESDNEAIKLKKDVLDKLKRNEKLTTDEDKAIVYALGLRSDSSTSDAIKFLENTINEAEKQANLRAQNFIAGPDLIGYWKIDKAKPVKMSESMKNADTPDATASNELVIMTNTTVPYTDRMGYRHIGALPYGANLAIVEGTGLVNMLDINGVATMAASKQLDITPADTDSNVQTTPPQKTTTEFVGPVIPPELQMNYELTILKEDGRVVQSVSNGRYTTYITPMDSRTPNNPVAVQLGSDVPQGYLFELKNDVSTTYVNLANQKDSQSLTVLPILK